jgi:glycosyltransferase involved in cell wall biosynthesis
MTTPAPGISVVLSTCNRREWLARALGCLLAQSGAPPHEILVVDNRSTDGTRELVESMAREVSDGRLVYAYEPRQGLSYARNAGIALARAPIIAFTDDDVLADPDWIASIERAFARHPAAQYVGGRVLPRWQAPPAWLTPLHWSPLALQDHGPEPFEVGTARPLCLVGANMAFRASAFRAAGLFSPRVQLLPGTLGSTEDHELMRRIWQLGGHGVYDPSIVVRADVQPERLTRGYHRRWHYAHGRSHARMQLPEMERSRARLLGVPVHLFRQALGHVLDLARHTIRRRLALAFHAEASLWFAAGFVRERIAGRASERDGLPAPPAFPLLEDPPLVSIVIPCYNQAAYLPESVASALAQSHRPVEVIVVDDGSTDATAAVALRHGGVKCLRQANRGLAHARNAGLAAARGRCLVFLDADDRLHPEAVARGVRALAGQPAAALAFGRARVIDAEGREMFTAPETAPLPGNDGYAALLASNVIWTPAVAIFRRETLEEAGGFDPGVHASADYDLYLRVARRHPVAAHGAVVADYRHHAGAMSRNAAVMLRTTLAVHRRHRRHARRDPRHRRAYREGRQFWQRFFGDQLMDEIRADVRRGGRFGYAALGLLVMARHAPRRLAWHTGRWLRNSGARIRLGTRARQP